MNTYAAQVTDGTVTQVIVGTAEWAASRLDGTWVDSLTLIGIGYTYTPEQGFRPPQPFPSWTWDDGWQPPAPMPDEGSWQWDEDAQSWVEVDGDLY
jgi:hypothetical protein